MKKIYEIPELAVVKLDLVDIVAASNPEIIVDTTEDVNAEEVESRRNNIWDDEEEW